MYLLKQDASFCTMCTKYFSPTANTCSKCLKEIEILSFHENDLGKFATVSYDNKTESVCVERIIERQV